MGQSKAHQWIHVLLPALLAALRPLGDAPARSLTALAQRLGGSEAEAATVVVLLAEEPAPVAAEPAATPASPLVPMLGQNGASSAPKTLLNRPVVYLSSADKYHRLPRRLSKGQKGPDERALIASQRPSEPW